MCADRSRRLRTPAAAAAYILTRQLDDGLGELCAFSL
jgi:hypothetical protein